MADGFGAWQVHNFASFSPHGVAATVAPADSGGFAQEADHHEMAERPVSLSSLNTPPHRVPRELLVEDTHVHVPIYAITAALLSLLVFGLDISGRARVAIVLLAFSAPCADFAGLWGAHLFPGAGTAFGALAVAGGFAMGLAYLLVLIPALSQSWLSRPKKENQDE